MREDPEDIGIELVDQTDTDAISDEISNENPLNVIKKSFMVMFNENQKHIQHRLLEISYYDAINSPHSNAEEDTIVEFARDFARDAYHEYASVICNDLDLDVSVSYTENMPDEEEFSFRQGIVEGFFDGRDLHNDDN